MYFIFFHFYLLNRKQVFSADIPSGDNTEVYHPEEVYAVQLPNTHQQVIIFLFK